MKKLSLTELKTVQLGILEEVAKYCKNNKIRYSLFFGTLLGAIRHKGYIPWDDDIDIMMPRPDYEKFIETFKTTNNEIRVVSILHDKNYPYSFAKVENANTKLIEFSDFCYDIGVNIDIFPIDGIPKENFFFQFFFQLLSLKRNLLLLKIIKIDFTKRRYYKNLILIFSKIVLKTISSRIIIRSINKQITKYQFNSSDYVMASSFPGIKKHHKMKRVNCERFIDLDFESNKYKGLKFYDEFLKMQYGNYMELPPLEERKTHHSFEAFYR